MTKFTKEEILCKQIAERYKKEIKYGDWYFWEVGKKVGLADRKHRLYIYKGDDYIPLWTISDCLEFLREREYTFERSYQLGGIFQVSFISGEGSIKGSGDTLLIACLKAVLAELEERK